MKITYEIEKPKNFSKEDKDKFLELLTEQKKSQRSGT